MSPGNDCHFPGLASFPNDAKTDKVLTGRQRGRKLRGRGLSRAEISSEYWLNKKMVMSGHFTLLTYPGGQ